MQQGRAYNSIDIRECSHSRFLGDVKMTVDEIRTHLFELSDEKYAKFQGGLIPDIGQDDFIGVRTPALKAFAKEFAQKMSTKMQSVDQFVSDLSGGNKQKVVLARWIGKDSDILVLDSPTRGIDIKVKQDIYQLMDKMRKQGKSIIMISEELMELIGMCDRIIIMKDGEINGELLRSYDMDENSLIEKMV